MRKKLTWLALAVALAVPVSLAWAAGDEPEAKPHSSCCCCNQSSCPKA